MFLQVQPIYIQPGHVLTETEIETTNTLHGLLLEVTGSRKYVAEQVIAARSSLGSEPVQTFTGNRIDELFKRRVKYLQTIGRLPSNLQTATPGISPDFWVDRTGWDVTTAEQGRHHFQRDVRPDPDKWDAYFILGY
jgi:hypothetical protein